MLGTSQEREYHIRGKYMYLVQIMGCISLELELGMQERGQECGVEDNENKQLLQSIYAAFNGFRRQSLECCRFYLFAI